MPNKIILLTIFLYITLNLRKIENFIQSGCKIESFMADGSSSKADGRLAKQKQIIAAQTSEYQISGAIAIIKLVFISGFYVFQINKHSNNTKHKIILAFLLVLLVALIGSIAAASASEDLSDDSWKTVITLSTLSNEVSNLMIIYITVKMSIEGVEIPAEMEKTLRMVFNGKQNAEAQERESQTTSQLADTLVQGKPGRDAPAGRSIGRRPASRKLGNQPAGSRI